MCVCAHKYTRYAHTCACGEKITSSGSLPQASEIVSHSLGRQESSRRAPGFAVHLRLQCWMTSARHHMGLFHMGSRYQTQALTFASTSCTEPSPLSLSMVGCLPQEQLLVGSSGLRAIACGGNMEGESSFHQVSSEMFEPGSRLCQVG